jgi:thioredoxin 1
MNGVVELNNDNFGDTVKSGVTLVDFWAPWCGPCMMQGPILENVADTVGGKAKIVKVNVDEGQAVAAQYGIRSIPTLIVFKDGQPLQQFVGVQSETNLVAAIEQAV